MADINLKTSDYLAISRAVDANNNNAIDNDEASVFFKSKTPVKGPITVAKLASSLEKGDAILSSVSKPAADNIANYFSERSTNANKILARWDKTTTISRAELPTPDNMKNLIDEDADDEISTQEFSNAITSEKISIGKTINLREQYVNQVIPNRMEERFGTDGSQLIKRFSKDPVGPYKKEYLCDIKNAVIDNTSSIKDFECSPLYEKKPQELAKDILETPNLKSNPELKEKVSKFLGLLETNDKASLASVKSLLERNPKVSDNDLKVIFDKLSTMLTTTYDPKVGDAKALVKAALHDVGMPTDISQERIGTCTATTVQIQLAMRNPIEYLKMLDTLAKNQPYTTLKGSTVPPNFTFVEEGVGENLDTGRTISSKIMQNAIMDFGDAETRAFDSRKGDGGLTYQQTAKALNEIINVSVESSWIWDYSPAQLIDIAKKSKPSFENPIEISLSYEKSGRDARHSVNLVAIDNNNVTIVNPWGKEETFPVAELQTRILSINNPVGIETSIVKIDPKAPEVKAKLLNDATKADMLSKISVGQKVEIIENITSTYDHTQQKYVLKPDTISESDKKVIITILDDLLKGGDAQNMDWYPRLKWIAPNKTELLQKIQLDSPNYSIINTKLMSNDLA